MPGTMKRKRVRLTPEQRAALSAIGKIGGRLGGPARAKKLSARRRSEIARKAGKAGGRGRPKKKA